ncbi:NAC domain-containing 82-like isoform X1 [Olea europaea subsp. europaea]|nr:NAC domain-containing 82-like isoform X1 [Olea europaea subsp. europaea]
MVKTLIFHLGHAPQGQRTDWVIHEFRILDKQLAEVGIQDSYVLCKVFEKKGPGPKNGAQYGAPFNEAEWDNDDETLICSGYFPSHDPSVSASTLPQNCSSSVKTSMVVPGSTLESSLIEAGPSSVRPSASDLVLNESDDDIVHLLAPFTAHSMLNFSEKRNREYHDNDEENNTSLLGTSGNDIYNGLHDLDYWAQMTEGEFDTIGMQEDGHLMNQMPLQNDVAYIELNDLIAPLDFCPDVNATEEISMGNLFVPYCPGNMDYVGFRGGFSGINPYASGLNQHPVMPAGSNRQEGCLDVLQTVNSDEVNANLGNNSAQVLDFTFTQPTEVGDFPKSLKRGRLDDI